MRPLLIICPRCEGHRSVPIPHEETCTCETPIDRPVRITCNRCLSAMSGKPLSVFEAIEAQHV